LQAAPQRRYAGTVKALVLSGGGARGAYEAGVIAGLYQAGERFDVICGTSIGAINAALVAQDDVDQLAAAWKTIGTTPVITYVPLVRKLLAIGDEIEIVRKGPLLLRLVDVLRLFAGVLGLGPISAVFKLMGAIAPEPIESILGRYLSFSGLKRSLVASATNVTDGTCDLFAYFTDAAQADAFARAQSAPTVARSLTAGNYVDAVRASTSIPGAFAPVTIAVDSSMFSYVDGGVANNTPIGQAIDAGATEVTVIFLTPSDVMSPQQIDNLMQVGLSCITVMQEKILETDLKTALRVNESVKRGAGGTGSGGARRMVRFRQFRPKTDLPIGILQFDRPDLIDSAFNAGLADAKSGGEVLSEV
jgi:NTE family protein